MNFIRSAERLRGFQKPTVWSIMTPLAIETKSTNLGQGFPSWQPPSFFTESLTRNVAKGNHQYTRAFGSPLLVNAITKYHKRFQKLNPLTNVLVTSGGVEALFSCFIGLVDPNDEVILFDPSYDCYRAQVQMAGGKSIAVPLKPKYYQNKSDIIKRNQGPYVSTDRDDWQIDFKRLRQSLNERTKVIVINSPHNPSGKVFTQDELKEIASLLKKYPRVVVIEDNVYEGLTFDNHYQKQLPKMSFIEDMQNRTISIYSAGKIFAATGTRVGWAIGPEYLIKALMSVHQYNVFCLHDPMQTTVAESLDIIGNNDYIKQYADRLLSARKLMIDQLLNSNYDFKLWVPKGGYFVMTDISGIRVQQKYFIDQKTNQRRSKDMAFCIKLALENGVVAIPCASFYDAQDLKLGQNMVRFAFCKEQELIREAGRRLSL